MSEYREAKPSSRNELMAYGLKKIARRCLSQVNAQEPEQNPYPSFLSLVSFDDEVGHFGGRCSFLFDRNHGL